MRKFIVGVVALWMILLWSGMASGQLSKTLHNLSSTGPGTLRAPGVQRLCVFCHTPHHSIPNQALWNRDLPPKTYKLYESSKLEAKLSQPTGASRLCLSCHDGTTAMGNLRKFPEKGRPNLGQLTGKGSLGLDLSDDHPISFIYDSDLSQKRGELADPSNIPKEIPLDSTEQLQCTTCHEPHSDPIRKFLRKNDVQSAMCTSCHKLRSWTGSAHATSTATWSGGGKNPWPGSPHKTVANNGCMNCHRVHAAPRPEFLLSDSQERGVCLVCHNDAVASKDIEKEFQKFNNHPIDFEEWVHAPGENPDTMTRHVTCVDCHNSHQSVSAPTNAPSLPGVLRGARGVNIAGSIVKEVSYEYEICLKCHGIGDQSTSSRVVRQDNTRNVRLEINPSNSSFHPVASVGKNSAMEGFELNYSVGSMIYCTDCHNNDEWTPEGPQPRGPHGSRFAPILEREYQVNDPTPETFQSYAMCYKCHNRNFLINDQANTFPHKKHVVEENTPCSVCHDAHGSRQKPHLINFMLQDRTGKTVVTPSSGGRLDYISLGQGQGQCYLTCHGKDHNPLTYPN